MKVIVEQRGYEPYFTNIKLFRQGEFVDYIYEDEPMTIEVNEPAELYFKVHFFKSKPFTISAENEIQFITIEFLSLLSPFLLTRKSTTPGWRELDDIEEDAYILNNLRRIIEYKSMFDLKLYKKQPATKGE